MLAALCQKKTRKLLTDSCARQALLPVQLLSAVFLGIGGGLSIFVLTRKFYHTGDVLYSNSVVLWNVSSLNLLFPCCAENLANSVCSGASTAIECVLPKRFLLKIRTQEKMT
eukprot:m.191645 g.191645  ORF g.191645 m.191645 type:complete len:112 (-) comp18597_c0_seq9:537-872(-)